MIHQGKNFYDAWAKQEIEKGSREIVLKWKAVNLANLALRKIKEQKINSLCEIGGAEGIVLYHIGKILDVPVLVNYELSSVFCVAGQARYPQINFINSDFSPVPNLVYDIIILSDIIEHVSDDSAFLEMVSKACHYSLLKIPIEECLTNHDWVYRLRNRKKPKSLVYGSDHMNGHLRGYTVPKAKASISEYFNILDQHVSDVNAFYGSPRSRLIQRWFGSKVVIWLYGGALFLLAESKMFHRRGSSSEF